MRVGPVGIVNGTFGNRPHCIYRGYCLQGCKVNAKASPTSPICPTHSPTTWRSAPTAWPSRSPSTPTPAAPAAWSTCRRRSGDGQTRRLQRAATVAVAGYSIETPRLLLASTSRRHPHGLGNNEDQVGRYVMVQGATQTAGRFPEELRSYKAPPPETSSEQFYETDTSRGFARGFSIQTVSPLPIGWAEHVLADGHWGRALREYMRDYNHWATIGVLNELLPHPDNRVTLADDLDPYGQPVARLDYTLSDNDKANMAYSTNVITGILRAADAQDVLTIQRFAHLVGGARMGTDPDNSVIDADHRIWGVPNCRRRRVRVPHPGRRQPGVDDHGARRTARRPHERQIRPHRPFHDPPRAGSHDHERLPMTRSPARPPCWRCRRSPWPGVAPLPPRPRRPRVRQHRGR